MLYIPRFQDYNLAMFNNALHTNMEIVLRRYGNSTVAVLPPSVLKEFRLSAGQPMTLTADDGKIVLTRKSKVTLADLIAQCDLSAPPPADLEWWDNARPVGNEVL
ncbi:MAG: ChpB-ChpS toxin-antitoxin system antitoxin [Proteobacteria bacterium]|nr:ChpB-ChpS toxin-antitoxin system antitoxin [Pseudomonadota bacterium]MCL2307659.1 ChpB-ChpS toxin-antitoxin system antitoxin [Pseudomonadota bacterium]